MRSILGSVGKILATKASWRNGRNRRWVFGEAGKDEPGEIQRAFSDGVVIEIGRIDVDADKVFSGEYVDTIGVFVLSYIAEPDNMLGLRSRLQKVDEGSKVVFGAGDNLEIDSVVTISPGTLEREVTALVLAASVLALADGVTDCGLDFCSS